MPSTLDILYGKINDEAVNYKNSPVIGISSNGKEGISCIANPYYQSVILSGGSPVVIPVTTDISALISIVKKLDGLILSGGADIDPRFYEEKPVSELGEVDSYRDIYDFELLRIAFNYQLPVFGICRGHQVINVAFGGSLYQDIHAQFSVEALKHSQEEARDAASHSIKLVDISSKLRTALKTKNGITLPVNSFHHQAVKNIAPEFIETAISADGLNEAIEHSEYSVFSVQWHPESMAVAGNETMLNLFRYFINQTTTFAKAKEIHKKYPTIDSHCDTPMFFHYDDVDIIKNREFSVNPKDFDVKDESPIPYRTKVNVEKMKQGMMDAAFMVAYIPQGVNDEISMKQATEKAEFLFGKLITLVKENSDVVEIARSMQDLTKLKKQNKKAVFLGLENGYALGYDIRNVDKFYDLGVRYLTLCHNGDNLICDSAVRSAQSNNGLSKFGRSVVKRMNALGMMIDISHASEKTFRDVIRLSSKPVIASHSSCRTLCNHCRNLDDGQIKALSENGGVIQICLYRDFINENPEKACLSDAIRHVLHVVDLAGVEHVGIGSDFDGGGELTGCKAANELIQITMRLIAEGFDDESIAKIWGGNLMRVMNYK
ncbi:MAG: gamma-glutamyl-gamma-aminobutyrate hydrolase family protein [Tannerella sp.]|jgi:microsomal dipeptidase-like Zn-dependent dipeptidase/gamma-glutamyl-gamma-aminobutyrate hydrolase PuuD|nr:gamma-glutamyl-gamma-aminobutyrate hydrolase family protein [Tannerella sp.]